MVKRYEVSEKYIGTGEYVGQMVACSDGDYVEFSDYDALAERLAEAERLLRQCSAVWRNQGPLPAIIAGFLENTADSAPAAPWTSGLLGYPCPTCGITLTADHDCTAETADEVQP